MPCREQQPLEQLCPKRGEADCDPVVMSAQVNGDSGVAVPQAQGDVHPASARPQPRSAADPHSALRWTAQAVGARPASNGQVVPAPSPVPAAESCATAKRPSLPPAHAGVVTRLLAAAVDAVVVVVLTALLDLATAGARFLWSPVDFRWPRPTTAVTVIVLLLVAGVYLAVGWALTGRTYGSRLMGLRVLSSRHQLLGWTRSVLRALVSVLWPVGLLWCGISRTRLSLADVVLRTVVVYDAEPYARVRDGEPPSTPEQAS
jgi:uncharacterized RDD family membrane protein YckC